MKQYGKETRHNVISRKDNLILTPHKPTITEENDKHLVNKTHERRGISTGERDELNAKFQSPRLLLKPGRQS